jgi:hypothetical protein
MPPFKSIWPTWRFSSRNWRKTPKLATASPNRKAKRETPQHPLITNTPIGMPRSASRFRILPSRSCWTAAGISRAFPWPPFAPP